MSNEVGASICFMASFWDSSSLHFTRDSGFTTGENENRESCMEYSYGQGMCHFCSIPLAKMLSMTHAAMCYGQATKCSLSRSPGGKETGAKTSQTTGLISALQLSSSAALWGSFFICKRVFISQNCFLMENSEHFQTIEMKRRLFLEL